MKGKSACFVLILLAIVFGIVFETPTIKDSNKPFDIKNIEVSKEDISKGIEKINAFGNDLANKLIGILKISGENNSSEKKPQNPISSEMVKATLIRVVDGDTIVVSINGVETKVRLIGVDTPESVSAVQSENSKYGDIASTYTKDLLKDSDYVYLQYDASQTDMYGRTLAYVWLKDNVDITSITDISTYMLNGLLVNNGYAKDRVFQPNSKYTDVFHQLEEKAKESGSGLFQFDEISKLWE